MLIIFSFSIFIFISFSEFVEQTFEKKDPGIWLGEPLIGSRADFLSGDAYGADPRILERISQEAQRGYTVVNQTASRPNIIIILADSLRPDHMSLYGYHRSTTPFLDKLDQQNKLQKSEQAFSSCSDSHCGILAMLNSKEYRNLHLSNFKLHEALSKTGYKTHFILSGEHDWYGLKEFYGANMDSIFDSGAESKYIAGDDELIFEALDKIELTSQPVFFYIHLMSAHATGIKHDRFNLYGQGEINFNWRDWAWGEYDKSSMIDRYDNGIVQSDSYIERIFSYLDENKLSDNSIVIIVSDHGEAFGEHGKYAHTHDLYAESINIPIIIVDSEQNQYPGLRHALQLDIAPTVARRARLPIPSSWQGRPLQDESAERLSFHQTRRRIPTFASIYFDGINTYKYISRGVLLHHPKDEALYNLTQDPSEQMNILDDSSDALKLRIKGSYYNTFVKYQ